MRVWHDSRMDDPGPSRLALAIVYTMLVAFGLLFTMSLYKGLI